MLRHDFMNDHLFQIMCYCKFIHQYTQIAKPLYKLISGDWAKTKQAKLSWNDKCEQAFKALKDICSHTLVLAYADYTKSF